MARTTHTVIKAVAGSDYEVWRGKQLIGTCGTVMAAGDLQNIVAGALLALRALRLGPQNKRTVSAIKQIESGFVDGGNSYGT